MIGYPFAGGGPKPGTEKTPDWLFAQQWFKDFKGVTHEMVNVTDRRNHNETDPRNDKYNCKNYLNVIESNRRLVFSIQNAIKDGKYPLIIGGDHS